MIICPNCEHINPDSASQCENCLTPLPKMSFCPHCGSTVQSDATFCGHCGESLGQGLPVAVASPAPEPAPVAPPPSPTLVSTPAAAPASSAPQGTVLQIQSGGLLHVQTGQIRELPSHLSVIHIGKPNDRVPPDIDVSGFPDSDIVSRVHADIRVEGGIYYLEDTGSSNGTYVNHTPLPPGNRHRLRAGDRISLGKGDKLTFIFQTGS